MLKGGNIQPLKTHCQRMVGFESDILNQNKVKKKEKEKERKKPA